MVAREPEASIRTAATLLGPLGRRDVPLGPFTTFRIGGPAALFVRLDTEADVPAVQRAVAESGIEVLVIGQGSNLLIGDQGFAGLAVQLGERFSSIELITDARLDRRDRLRLLRAGGAVKLPVLARRSVALGLQGLVWAVGVPGSVGGGVRMNAGGHGSDMAASVRDASLCDLRVPGSGIRVVSIGDLGLGYRRSAIGSTDLVVSATFALEPGDRHACEAELGEIVRWRRSHQPGGANCGSVFTNPDGDSAGRLIDQAGLRGLRLGTASVSEKHANFIQADDQGRCADVWALIVTVRRRVHDRFGIWLHPEVRTAGFDAALDDTGHREMTTRPTSTPPTPTAPSGRKLP